MRGLPPPAGSLATDMNSPDRPLAVAQQAANPMHRFGSPEEIAARIVFLAGPGASFVTDAVLYIDAGYPFRPANEKEPVTLGGAISSMTTNDQIANHNAGPLPSRDPDGPPAPPYPRAAPHRAYRAHALTVPSSTVNNGQYRRARAPARARILRRFPWSHAPLIYQAPLIPKLRTRV
ncbi:SDR family oxidoreductase [Streptomyces decoyicus]|uniref:SDR family oxidoreductase n=1 Tax=Streptomyces decoyicus TaxID=249567 RepID=UPI003870CE09